MRLGRKRAAREGWQVAREFSDHAVFGASMVRPGLQDLLEDARRGAFDLLVTEALDRLSHDQADVASLYEHLTFAGVRIITLAEGEVDGLHVGLKGTMNQLFLKDLANKTRRGLRGRVAQDTTAMASNWLRFVGTAQVDKARRGNGWRQGQRCRTKP